MIMKSKAQRKPQKKYSDQLASKSHKEIAIATCYLLATIAAISATCLWWWMAIIALICLLLFFRFVESFFDFRAHMRTQRDAEYERSIRRNSPCWPKKV